MPQVSVIVAARNEAGRIGACVASLLEQADVDLEVVVVDDGSADATAAELAAITDPRLVVIHNDEPLGRGGARNRALGVVRSEIVAIQDADDVALAGKLNTLVAMLLDDPDLVAVGGQCIAVTPGGRFWLHTEFPLDSDVIAARLADGVMGVCHTASAMRRQAIEAVGGYSADYPRAQDLELFRRLAALGPMRNTDQSLVIYRHAVLLPWSYWNLTRDAERRMTGRRAPSLMRRTIRYVAANARRVVRFSITTKRARALVRAADAPPRTPKRATSSS